MSGYRVEFSRSAYAAFVKLEPQIRRRLAPRISALALDPHPPDAKHLAGNELYRIRVGAYRIVYQVEDEVLLVLVVKLGHRRDVYRGL